MKEEDEKKEAFRPPGVNNWKKIVQKKCFLLLDLVETCFLISIYLSIDFLLFFEQRNVRKILFSILFYW